MNTVNILFGIVFVMLIWVLVRVLFPSDDVLVRNAVRTVQLMEQKYCYAQEVVSEGKYVSWFDGAYHTSHIWLKHEVWRNAFMDYAELKGWTVDINPGNGYRQPYLYVRKGLHYKL